MSNSSHSPRLLIIAFIVGVGIAMISTLISRQIGTETVSAQAGGFERSVIDANFWGRTAIGDIDNDGKNDVVVHRWGGARGNQSGGNNGELVWYKYPSWQKFSVKADDGFQGDAVVVADVDGNGYGDIVASKNANAAEVWLYLHQGSNNWTERQIGTLEQGSEIKDIEIHDMDGDGKLDIIARSKGRTGVYFQDSSTSWNLSARDSKPREGMTIGNVGGSSHDDIVLNGFWFENLGNRNVGSWPERTFDSNWYTQSGGGFQDNAVTVDVADINSDGRNDIVACSAEQENTPLNWYENTGSGWDKHQISTLDKCHSMHADKFNSDGFVDIVAIELHRKADAASYIFVNNGSEVFQRIKIADGGGYKSATGDIDNDGDVDVTSAKAWNSGENGIVGGSGSPVYLLRNGGGPPIGGGECDLDSWQRHVVDQARPWDAIFVYPGQIDGDELTDIVAGGYWYKNPGNPGGVWQRNEIGGGLENMALVDDIDGDGDDDIFGQEGRGSLASISNAKLYWAENDGSGNFMVHDNLPNGGGDFLQGADRSGNLIALSWHGKASGVQGLTIGSWSLRNLSSTNLEEDVTFGNIDRSGGDDLLLGTAWLRNNGENFSNHTISNKTPADRNDLADINKDGRLDAVVGFEAISSPGDIIWYEQPVEATSTWTPHIIGTITGPMSLDVEDMDGDGDYDVVAGEHNLSNPSSARAIVFENTDGAGGSWTPHTIYTGDEHHDGTQIVDIDSDGDKDVISIGWRNNKVVLYENTSSCDSTFPTPSISPPITGPSTTPGLCSPTQIKIIDQEVQFTYADNGFHTLKNHGETIPGAPVNWLSPTNYYNGEWYFRYELLTSAVNNTPGRLQTCIWNMPGNFPENCAGQVAHNGTAGGVFYLNRSPATWWKNQGVPLDFSDSTPFRIRAVLRGESGCNVTRHNVKRPCWEWFDEYEPMRFRVSVVMVPEGEVFCGWGNIDNPILPPITAVPPLPNTRPKVPDWIFGARRWLDIYLNRQGVPLPFNSCVAVSNSCQLAGGCCMAASDCSAEGGFQSGGRGCAVGICCTPTQSPQGAGGCGAGSVYTALGCIPVDTPSAFIEFVLQRGLSIGGGITFLLLIYASYLYMTSSGDPKKLQSAKDLFTAALSGLLIIIFAVVFLRIAGLEVLRIPGL